MHGPARIPGRGDRGPREQPGLGWDHPTPTPGVAVGWIRVEGYDSALPAARCWCRSRCSCALVRRPSCAAQKRMARCTHALAALLALCAMSPASAAMKFTFVKSTDTDTDTDFEGFLPSWLVRASRTSATPFWMCAFERVLRPDCAHVWPATRAHINRRLRRAFTVRRRR